MYGNTISNGNLIINGPIIVGVWKIFESDVVVSGSIKVDYIIPQWWGAIGNGITDDTVAIQSAFDSDITRSVYFPTGTYLISSSVKIKGYNRRFYGDSQEGTKIVQGTQGENCFEGDTSVQSLFRVEIDHLNFEGVSGTGHAIYFTQLYDSHIHNIRGYTGGSTIKIDQCFSCYFVRIIANSRNSHAIHVSSNNTVVFQSCYAHRIDTAGKAGFYIIGEAHLISCNMVDYGEIGVYLATGNGTGRYIFDMCNFEDCSGYGVYVESGAISMLFNQCYWKSPTTGTYQCSLYVENSNKPVIINACTLVPRGATRILPREVVFNSGGGNGYRIRSGVTGGSAQFTPVWKNGVETTAPLNYGSNAAYAIMAEYFNNLDCGRFFGKIAQDPKLIPNGATSFDASINNLYYTGNTSATNISAATGGLEGQRITILIKDSNTTLRHGVGGAGRFMNTSGADINAVLGQVVEYVYCLSVWQQV